MRCWVPFEYSGVVEFSDAVFGSQRLGCGFAVNAPEAAAGFGGFVVEDFAKIKNAVAESLGKARQFFCAEQDEHQSEDEDNLTTAEIEQSKEGLHERNILTNEKISITRRAP